jgi:hypothetical protein
LGGTVAHAWPIATHDAASLVLVGLVCRLVLVALAASATSAGAESLLGMHAIARLALVFAGM